MPKIDTTQGEFWASEAQREGKGRSGAEVMRDFYAEMDAEVEKERLQLLQPEVALQKLQQLRHWWNKGVERTEQMPFPQQVLEVMQVDYATSFGGGRCHMIMKVRTARRDLLVTVDESYTNDSRLVQGDYDLNLTWQKLPRTPTY
jgi:hypothetical protein